VDFIFIIEIVLFIILLGLSSFFSSSETALFSLNSVHLEQMRNEGNKKVNLIETMLAEPRRLIVTILIGNEFVNVTASVISTSIIIQLFGPENKLYNLFIMVPILLIVGEITPKTLAIKNKVAFASFECQPIETFSKLITPLRWVVRNSSDFFITLLIGNQRSRGNLVTEDMVRTLAQDAVGKGALDQQEAHYIEKIFEFGNIRIEDMLTPRSDIIFIPADTSMSKIVDIQHQSKQSRFPVYGEHRDNVIGILHARDLLDIQIDKFENKDLLQLLRKPYFVPESKPAIELFDKFREQKRSFALTLDEYGGVTGLVTMEDLLECIFGDIHSPSDRQKKTRIQEIENNHYVMDGIIPLDEFNQFFKTDLAEDNLETLSGYVLHTIGELPHKNEIVDSDGFRFTVLKVARNRIEEIQVTKLDSIIEAKNTIDIESDIQKSNTKHDSPDIKSERLSRENN